MLQRLDTTYPYQGVDIMATDAEIHYAARMREIYDGFWKTGNTFYSSPKDQPYMHPPFAEMIPAYIARVTGLHPASAFALFAGLCGAALFVAVLSALKSLTGRKWESLLAVCTLFFAGPLLGAPWDLFTIIEGVGFYEPLRFTRPINPLWTASWFFACISITANWIRMPRGWHMPALIACITVLVYSYVYAWSYIAATLGLLTLYFAYRGSWSRVLTLLLSAVIIGVLSIPYLLNLVEVLQHPLYPESSMRMGLHHSREPVVGVWMLVALGLCLASSRLWKSNASLIICLLLGGIIAINQHVITGSHIVAHHYHWYFFHPIASLLFLVAILQMSSAFAPQRFIRIVGITVPIVVIVFGLRYQTLAYASVRDHWGRYQSLAPVLTELSVLTKTGDVVFSADVNVMDLVPIYTSADVYYSTNANNYLVPDTHARMTYFFQLWTQGVTAVEAKDTFFSTRRAELSSAVHAIYYREVLGSYAAISDQEVSEHLDAYRSFLSLSEEEKLQLQPISFVVFTPYDQRSRAMNTLRARAEIVFEDSGFEIGRMRESSR
ncbi:MAG: hypothetical protein ABL890_03205 [Candidatus Peribacteraceae bacterium]